MEACFEQVVWAGRGAASEKLRTLAERLARQRRRYLLFLWQRDAPLDNNHAERQLRGPVIVRKSSFGTRSDIGSIVFADLLSVITTLYQQGGDLLEFLPRAFEQLLLGQVPVLVVEDAN